MSEKQHAKLSASGAHRWMKCPGSVRLEETLPDSTSSYAEEGTAAHQLAERCLRENANAEAFLGELFNDHVADKEMTDAVQIYLDYVRDLPGASFIEKRVDFSPWVPEGFGTGDFICINDNVLTIVDLKYGKGVEVDAVENEQEALYALGALNEYGFLYDCEKFKMVIVQPRKDHISEWTIAREELLAFGEVAKECAARALEDDAPLIPDTKACQFCRARGSCRALAEHNYDLAVVGFEAIGEPIELKNSDLLTEAELSSLLEEIDILAGWADAVKSDATTRLMRGDPIPGFKLVEGRSNRKWADEEAAGKALARKLTAGVAYNKKVITITEAEKHLGKKNPLIAKYTIKPEGKPTLAPESSPKEALQFNPTDGFEDVKQAA
ncbi:MAG: DUF2800 domain-containing protein [Alphaproteobacteria bacterium]|nr:DUF2800 domain-containing protein [Alphaproteobacteria bacterium]